ncbi:MAG: glycoside hydrolase domain-containing protein [Cyanobacteria bacterium J06648_1]
MSYSLSKFARTVTFVLAGLIAVFSISYISNSQVQLEPMFWTASAMEAIALHQPSPKPGESNSQIRLRAARGEYEAFQIVVKAPPGNLKNVNVMVSDLQSADGSLISRDNLTLYREQYIWLDRPSHQGWSANPTRGKGWYADALIPFVDPQTGKDIQHAELDAVPFELKAGTNQPIWVDIFVPRTTIPGDYRGTFTVSSDRGTAQGDIFLKVWNFDLPVQPSFDSFFDIWEDRGIEAQTLLLQHRLMSSQRLEYPDQSAVFNRLGVRSVRLPFWSGANYHTCKMNPPPSVERLKQSAARYSSNLLRYVFSADEIDLCESLEQPLQEWARRIHQAGLKHLVVMKPKPALYDAVDIWVVNPKMYAEAQAEIAEVKKRGDQVWFYTGYSTNYSPLWHLDSAPINFRIAQGWIAQSLDLQGVLVARADTWTENPWQEVPIYVQGKIDYPGIEMFFYPGDKVGLDQVVPSIRLKRLREGMEDYEYIELLKKQGQEDWAMEIVRSVGRNWRDWTKDIQTLELARQRLGEKINSLVAQKEIVTDEMS